MRLSQTLVVLSLLGLTGCGPNLGSKVQHGNIEVYYTEGVTQAEADRLGTYLVKHWGAQPARRSVQLKKAPDGYQFCMVVRKEFQQDEKLLKQLEFDAARISRDALDGAAVEMHACDEQMNTLKAFPPRPDVRYSVVDGKAEVFFAANVDKAEAQRLAKYLAQQLKDATMPISFKLARRGAVVEVHMVVQREQLNNQATIAGLRRDAKDMAVSVFPGATIEMHLCDELLNVVQVLNP